MRFSVVAVSFLSAFAIAKPSMPVAREAGPAALPEALSSADQLNNLVARQLFPDSFTAVLNSLETLLSATTLNEIISIVQHASSLLDDTTTPQLKTVVGNAAILLNANNTAAISNLLTAAGPILADVGPVLTALAKAFGV